MAPIGQKGWGGLLIEGGYFRGYRTKTAHTPFDVIYEAFYWVWSIESLNRQDSLINELRDISNCDGPISEICR